MSTPLNKRSRRVLILTFAAFLSAPALFSSDSEITLRGHLDRQSVQASASAEQPLGFVTNEGKKFEVSGDFISNAQLRDPQLLEREWELVGSTQPDGHFEIVKQFTIKDGKRYRVTYFCEICNITTYEPGRCMCCQGPTDLHEIPAQ
jgi:hypothetical protein